MGDTIIRGVLAMGRHFVLSRGLSQIYWLTSQTYFFIMSNIPSIFDNEVRIDYILCKPELTIVVAQVHEYLTRISSRETFYSQINC